MTIIVGILCKDGVVMGSDSAATFGTGTQSTIGQQAIQKVRRINEHVLFSSTGAVGISQIIADKLESLWAGGAFTGINTPPAMMDRVGKEIGLVVAPYFQLASLQRNLTGESSSTLCKTLLALPVNRKPHLFNFDYSGVPEHSSRDLPFIALGSGQFIADPFLALLRRLLWTTTEPTLAEGRLAVVWTIDHVRRTNPGGVGGGIQLAMLGGSAGSVPTVTMVTEFAVQEHLQKIESAEQTLVRELRGLATLAAVPAVPTPPPAGQ